MPAQLYLCIHLRDFAAQAVSRACPELRNRSLAILSGKPPLEYVSGLNQLARDEGLEPGMSRVQAESFAGTAVLKRDRTLEDQAFAELLCYAERFSPKVQAIAAPQEFFSGATLLLDIANSEKLMGTAGQIAESVFHQTQALGYEVSVATSGNACASILTARGRQGITVIEPGGEARAMAPLPLSVLELTDAQSQTFAAWGIHTLGQIAALPPKSLVARIGQDGQRLYLMARGAYHHLLVPEETPPDSEFIEHVELEHPVELLEPLLFLLSDRLNKITQHAAQYALAIASVETCLILDAPPRTAYRRTIRPALPERDAQTLLKLVQLDLELHPPQSGIMAFTLRAQPAEPQKVQQGLFEPQSPEAGRLEVLLARLRKLVGEERVGVPELLDSHAPEAFRMAKFQPEKASPPDADHSMLSAAPSALRMVRPPLAVRVGIREAAPATLAFQGKHFSVKTRSGPWRTNGAWWTNAQWCREEWDIAVDDAQWRCLRLAYDPGENCWYLIGVYD